MGQNVYGRIAHGAKCLWGESPMGRNVHGANCLWGENADNTAVTFVDANFVKGNHFKYQCFELICHNY